MAEVLRNAGNAEGHTFLLIEDLLERVKKQFSRPGIFIPDQELVLYNTSLYEPVVAVTASDSGHIVELKDYVEMNEIVRDRIRRLAESRSTTVDMEWAPILKEVLKSEVDERDEREVASRKEKKDALSKLASHRLSVLVGAAGTGKTKVIGALLAGLKKAEGSVPVLLLAPTGKARMRLEEETSEVAFTIHQFLMEKDWIRS